MSRRKLTPGMTASIVGLLDDGNYISTACRYVGISEASYYAWVDRARAEVDRVDGGGHDAEGLLAAASAGRKLEEVLEDCPDGFDPLEWPYVVFASWTTRARAQAEARAVKSIRTAALSGDWRAAGWYLTHAHPRQWGAAAPGVEAAPDAVETISVDALEAKLMSIMGPLDDDA